MPEITNAEYQEYMSLQTETKRLKEDAENTAKGLKANRDEIKTLKEQLSEKDTVIEDKDKIISEKEEALTTKEEELTTVKETAEKWTSHEESQKQALTDSIEKMKTDLGDKFDDNVKSFIEDLPETKVEAYLKGLLPADDGKGNPPSTDDGKGGNTPGGSDPSKFDSYIAGKDTGEVDIDAMVANLDG